MLWEMTVFPLKVINNKLQRRGSALIEDVTFTEHLFYARLSASSF